MFAQMKKDIDAIMLRDPAAKTRLEAALCYPGLHAIWLHRIAHHFYLKGWVVFPRLLNTFSRFLTGIDIHPGAKLGPGLFIDHGMGLVIGETAELGSNVTLYQGVTLGGTGKEKGKRHPTIGNNVLIGCGAKVLGPFKVGDGSRIASNSVVLSEVPENATAVGVPARIVRIAGKKVDYAGEVDQIHVTDPVQKTLDALTSRLDALEKQIEDQYMQGIDNGYGFDPKDVPHPDDKKSESDDKEC